MIFIFTLWYIQICYSVTVYKTPRSAYKHIVDPDSVTPNTNPDLNPNDTNVDELSELFEIDIEESRNYLLDFKRLGNHILNEVEKMKSEYGNKYKELIDNLNNELENTLTNFDNSYENKKNILKLPENISIEEIKNILIQMFHTNFLFLELKLENLLKNISENKTELSNHLNVEVFISRINYLKIKGIFDQYLVDLNLLYEQDVIISQKSKSDFLTEVKDTLKVFFDPSDMSDIEIVIY